MRWTRSNRSRNLEDRRAGSGRLRRKMPLGIGGILILLLASIIFQQDFLSLIDPGAATFESDITSTDEPLQTSAEEEKLVDFVSFVLDDAQNTWTQIFRESGIEYRETKLVLFRDSIRSACGFASSATGPFYCPGDQKVYIDLGFYQDLRNRFGASGDFAQAYVLAHEIGHHVQNLLGIERKLRQAQRSQPGRANQLSVQMELQADCFAGIWGNSTARRDLLEAGDIEEGLNAAAAIGDDRIQKMSAGYINPDAFTHGSSVQRVEWFKRGLKDGNPELCDTFGNN